MASNRRYLMPNGAVRFDRTSSTRDPIARDAPENLVDPWLKTLSFWDGDTPLAAVSAYAVHPMSYYGQGDVSADFPGLARRRRQLYRPAHGAVRHRPNCWPAAGGVAADAGRHARARL